MLTTKMQKAFLLFFVSLTVLFLVLVWPFAKAAFLAFTLTIVFAPLYRFMLHKFRSYRYLAAFFTTVVIAACVLLPLTVLGVVLISHIGEFLQTMISQISAGSFAGTFQPIFNTIHQWIENLTGSALLTSNFEREILKNVEMVLRTLYSFSPRILSSTISIILNFFLMLLFLIVFFAEGVSLYRWLMETSPLSSTHLEKMWAEMRMTITTSMTASLLIALLQGSLLGLGFWVVGFKQPYSWWVVAMIMSVIPVIGAVSCYVTASIILFASGDTQWGIAFLIYGVAIVSSIDNVIRPLLVRGTARIHPVLLFVTLIGAAKLFGPIGIVVGPVLLSIFLAALRIYRQEFVGQQA